MAAASLLCLCDTNLIHSSRKESPWHPKLFPGVGHKILDLSVTRKRNRTHPGCQKGNLSHKFSVSATTEGSAKSNKSEETIPSWARPDSSEPPPWAQDEGMGNESEKSFEIPFYVYLLTSAVTAIAAIGSIFEYANKKPVFGVLSSDSIFYAPLLGFFVFTGIPTSAFLWFKSVQTANKEAEEQDKRDGYF